MSLPQVTLGRMSRGPGPGFPALARGERASPRLDESGQSLLEFLLVLPMMVGLSVLLVRVNTAIQVSIVNQQYSRAQALWLTFNSPYFPELHLRAKYMDEDKANRMVIGVSDNAAPDAGKYVPEATVMALTRNKKKAGEPEPQSEKDELGKIRIRSTVALCTQTNVFTGTGGKKTMEFLAEGVTPGSFYYCGSPYDE